MSSGILEHLPWDSEFFGHDVLRLRASSPEDAQMLDQIPKPSLVYVFSDSPMNSCLADEQARLVDVKVTFEQKITPSQSTLYPDGIRSLSGQKASPTLIQLALDSGQYSRYAQDPRIEKGQFEKLYRQWLENSLNGSVADEIVGYFDQLGQLRGFCTLKLHRESASIGLIAVDQSSRGMGVGRRMIEFARAHTARAGLGKLTVVTQEANAGAMGFYQGTGFSIAERSYVYHVWMD